MSEYIQTWRIEPVLNLIQTNGVQALGFWDGCACSHFSVRGVDVEIGCGKGGERAVWVSSSASDFDGLNDALAPIAEEVARQVSEADGRGEVARHLHAWKSNRAA